MAGFGLFSDKGRIIEQFDAIGKIFRIILNNLFQKFHCKGVPFK
jgi:hypothetical protein